MSRKSLVPIELPADPTAPLEAATKQYVDANAGGGGGDSVPVGAVFMWVSNTLPGKYLHCDATAYSRAAYPELFAVIGLTYTLGGDDGSTFQVPNMASKFPIGQGASGALGVAGGGSTHTHTVPNHGHGGDTGTTGSSHTHVVPNISGTGGHDHSGGTKATNTTTGGTATRVTDVPSQTHGHTVNDATTSGSGHTHNITSQTGLVSGSEDHKPPFLVFNYIIRALP